MSNKKYKFDLDYENENYKKVDVVPTQKFDLSSIDDQTLISELEQLSIDELKYKLENEKLSKEIIDLIQVIIANKK